MSQSFGKRLGAGFGLAALAASGLMVPTAAAEQMFFFPQKGQTQEQQNADRGACHSWAVQQTGFDPGMADAVQQQEAGSTAGGVVKGGAIGAAGGAAVGAIAGNAGKGAAIGAIGGGLIGGAKRHSDQKKADQANRNAQAQRNAQLQNYRRALGACMEGKGYSVG